jgi:hypothetical protein
MGPCGVCFRAAHMEALGVANHEHMDVCMGAQQLVALRLFAHNLLGFR